MGKSIRSKIKRKHRAEFRATIGTEAHNKTMAIVQKKLNECVNKGQMNSFERIANLLDTTEAVEDTTMETSTLAGAEAPAKTAMEEKLLSAKGENKIPSKTFKKQKHQIASKSKKNKEKKERPKPRYFCEFK